jgi:hypothetical protein
LRTKEPLKSGAYMRLVGMRKGEFVVQNRERKGDIEVVQMEGDERHKFWHCVVSIGRRVRACKRLSEAAKMLTTRDHVRGISGPSTLLNRGYCGRACRPRKLATTRIGVILVGRR